MAIPGFFAGGMLGAAVAKIVGTLRGCTPPQGFPACDIWSFVLPAGIVGSLLLAAVIVIRLGRDRGGLDSTERS
jgi:hypothetical protein